MNGVHSELPRTSTAAPAATQSPYRSLEAYIALPRIESLALSPDGTRVVLTVATLSDDRTAYRRALWEVPADGSAPPRRLTRGSAGESSAMFTRDGDLLFTATRNSGKDAKSGDEAKTQLWILPAAGGEPRALTAIAGGLSGVAAVATRSSTAVLTAAMLPRSVSLEQDEALRAERAERKVNAILYDRYPVRYWDSDIGPAEPHLFAVDLAGGGPEPVAPLGADDVDQQAYPTHLPGLRDLTPQPGRSTSALAAAVTPDGARVFATLRRAQGRAERSALVAIDVASGTQVPLADEDSIDFEQPVVSHDGRSLAYLRAPFSTPQGPSDRELWVSGIGGAGARRLAPHWDHWANEFVFDHDDTSLLVVADSDGRAPIFRVPLDGGEARQVTQGDFAYSHLNVGPDGTIFALRSNWQVPEHPVRIAHDGTVTRLPTPAPPPEPVAVMSEVETWVGHGAHGQSRVRSWLLTPPGASAAAPAPLVLWVHGGPLSSWNCWSWRWCAQLLVARGYAVLLPDPALSTGYGIEFIARGWNAWGGAPYTDLMAITDAATARPEIDGTRTAAMGGSFGGYMANWIAGHTDRFDAIVTHASLWALDQFASTTDGADYWEQIFEPEAAWENSPHRFVADIRSPMLVIHGDRDYRVPIGEGIRLWADLAQEFAAADGSMPHRYLYFPDENHWILTPQHAKVWYETVLGFLGQHVLGASWDRPEGLG